MGALVKITPVAAEAIEGLADADAAAELLNDRYYDMRRRLDQANGDVKAGVAQRDSLLERAKAGEVVLGEEVAEVEAAIRMAESTVALMTEALPAVVKQIAEAETLVERLACRPMATAKADAERRYQAAQEALRAAQIESSAAWQANEAARFMTMANMGSEQLRLYAPAALERRAILEKVLQRDKKVADAVRVAQQARVASDIRNTEIERRQADVASGRYLSA